MRRIIERALAAAALVLLSPVLLLLAVLIKLDSPGPVFHRARRIGKGGTPFTMYKLRSMVAGAESMGPGLTAAGDPRITRRGRFLRNTKLDELPQLMNVVKGEMSLVGPRPEDPRYIECYTQDQRRVLDVLPGMTSVASLAFRNEASVLPPGDPTATYLSLVLPEKLALELQYLDRQSLGTDLMVLARTLLAVGGLESLARRMSAFIRRRVPWALIDATVVAGGYLAAVLSRFVDGPSRDGERALNSLAFWLLPLIAINVVMGYIWRLDRRVWRYARAPDVLVILAAAATSTACAAAADIWLGFTREQRPLPLSVVLLGGFFTFCGLVFVRYRSRLVSGLWARKRLRTSNGPSRVRTLIYGAGETGQLLAWRLLTQPDGESYDIVGFMDDDLAKRGLHIHGRPVLGGGSDLKPVVAREAVEMIILAIANTTGERIRDIVSAGLETSAQLRIVPSLLDLIVRSPRVPLLRDVQIEDLLARKALQVDVASCKVAVEGKVVLVTGGCGSIGSELCRQLVHFGPRNLLILDNNETGLYDLENELRILAPDANFSIALADVTDPDRMRAVFAREQPQVIFHAAAYKHVPLMERNPEEAIRVNVLGTGVVLDQAAASAVERFVLVSTDKAVRPNSVMGATKRVAEMVTVQTAAEIRSRTANTAAPAMPLCTVVRFGNVLGSRGSVVPTFARQIELGGPVTITHPDMTRYFMAVSEAASLIIQAATMTTGGDIFMLEMGEQIRIDDLARKMIRMRGLRPDLDIPIVYTGVRPGEKLNEDLAYSREKRQPTSHPLIHRLNGSARTGFPGIRRRIEQLAFLAAEGRREQLLRELKRLSRPSGTTSLAEAVPQPAGDQVQVPRQRLVASGGTD